jgi:hypothetical protein
MISGFHDSSRLVQSLCLRFEVPTAVSMNGAVFLDVTRCSLVEISEENTAAISRAAWSLEMFVSSYKTTWRHIPKDGAYSILFITIIC